MEGFVILEQWEYINFLNSMIYVDVRQQIIHSHPTECTFGTLISMASMTEYLALVNDLHYCSVI
jgi:hypothetical protein